MRGIVELVRQLRDKTRAAGAGKRLRAKPKKRARLDSKSKHDGKAYARDKGGSAVRRLVKELTACELEREIERSA